MTSRADLHVLIVPEELDCDEMGNKTYAQHGYTRRVMFQEIFQ